MKNAFFGLILFFLSAGLIISVMTIKGRDVKANEIEQNMDAVIEDALDTVINEKSYTVENNEEFVADLIEYLVVGISQDGESDEKNGYSVDDIDVKLMGIDAEKGMLSVRIKISYTNINGKSGEYETDRTAILEQTTKKDIESHVVIYEIKDSKGAWVPYKELEVTDGSAIKALTYVSIDGVKKSVASYQIAENVELTEKTDIQGYNGRTTYKNASFTTCSARAASEADVANDYTETDVDTLFEDLTIGSAYITTDNVNLYPCHGNTVIRLTY